MESWQSELREGFRDPESLLRFLNIKKLENVFLQSSFPTRVPLSFANRMEKYNIDDPLLLQVLPNLNEKLITPEFKKDAVGDLKSIKHKGLIQKYKGRVLLILTGSCAVHCRYCFRRHFPYSEQIMSTETKKEILKIIKNDPTIEEVIFSGGDPLLLTNQSLQEWSQDLLQISNIKRWRIHTRLPSVLPSRIDLGLIEILKNFQTNNRKVILVSHINHPNEFNDEVNFAFNKFQKASITLLNQSVLLSGINDNSLILKSLSEKLFLNGVLPYYLHLLDRTQGTQHFEVNIEETKKIYHELTSILPGYLVPKLVREIDGEPYKIIFGHA